MCSANGKHCKIEKRKESVDKLFTFYYMNSLMSNVFVTYKRLWCSLKCNSKM